MLCYFDHHDSAYDWASRRKIETHPVTGAAQIVEIRETVREIQTPLHIPAEAATNPEPKRPLSNLKEADLLSYGVPAEWIPDVRTADTERHLLGVCGRSFAGCMQLKTAAVSVGCAPLRALRGLPCPGHWCLHWHVHTLPVAPCTHSLAGCL